MSNNTASTTKNTNANTTETVKRKSGGSHDGAVAKKSKTLKTKSSASDTLNLATSKKSDFKMLTLKDIRKKLELLCERVPLVPEGNFAVGKDDKTGEPIIDETATREWAAQLQVVLEEFNLYICCVGTATYKWGTERSGAGDQHLTLLLTEISSSQEQISTAVTPRLTNLLAPVVDLVVDKTVTYNEKRSRTKEGTEGESQTAPTTVEVKENHYTRKLVDPAFLTLCHKILARNAPLLRHVVLSNFHKLLSAMKDFLKAQENDTQHNRSFTY